MSLADKIAGATDLHTKTIEVPEWDVTLVLREMSGRVRAEFEGRVAELNESGDPVDTVRMLALLVVRCAHDEDGSKVFSDEHIDMLLRKSLSVLKRIADEALALSAMTEGDIEELAGN